MAKAVVLTGGIGSGKTTVEKIFVSLGIETIDADKISHSLLNKNTETYEKIVDVFGRFILTDQDEIDRSKMREIIFRNPTAKKRLEKYLHPRIQSVMDEKVKVAKGPYVLQVVPLWYEIYKKKRPPGVWKIIVVETTLECRRSRTLRRSEADKKTFDLIVNNQASDIERRTIADNVINNHGNLKQLEIQVNLIHEGYINWLTKS